MSQEYIPVTWVDETDDHVGTVINKARLDQMQTAHHYADGFEEVDVVPTADPGVNYHKVVFCTADTMFYRWTGSQWVKDILSGKVDKLVTKPTAGTYTKVTINIEGQVTGGANPTTLAGYGITDAVTLNTAQTVNGIKTLTEAKTTTRAYASANVNDIVTIGSLASNPSVIHTTGNETKTGNLTISGVFTTNNNLNVRKNQPRTSLADTSTNLNAGTITAGDRGFFALYDTGGNIIGDIIISIDATGKGSIRARARNSDGTTRQVTLI